jgi:glycine cleavage system H lipoate-binding protein
MNYQNSKWLVSIIILAIIIVVAAIAIVGYLANIDKRVSQLEKVTYLGITPTEKITENGKQIAVDNSTKPIEEIIKPDDSVAITGTIVKIEEKAIFINMDMNTDGEDYDYIVRIDESTSLNKQKTIDDESTIPANIADINIGDIAIIESAGQIGGGNEFTARKINFLPAAEN